MSTKNSMSIEKVSESIELALQECGISTISKLPAFLQAVKMAQGIRALREALTDEFVRSTLMPLQGTPLGFLTDKDREKDGSPGPGYPVHVVRDCAIESMLRGFSVVGNEFNIIAGRFYGALNGFERKVQEFPGLTELDVRPGVPHFVGDKGALVPFTVSWRLNGKPQSLECQITKDGEGNVLDQRIPVKVNGGMGLDAILGKATRKAFYRVYKRLSGATFGLSDGEVGEDAIVTSGESVPALTPSPIPAGAAEGRRISVGTSKKASAPAAEPKPEVKPDAPAAAAKPEAPAALPPVDITELQKALSGADKAWAPDSIALMVARNKIVAWTEEQRRSALRWAMAVTLDGPFGIQADRPPHTVIERVPGED